MGCFSYGLKALKLDALAMFTERLFWTMRPSENAFIVRSVPLTVLCPWKKWHDRRTSDPLRVRLRTSDNCWDATFGAGCAVPYLRTFSVVSPVLFYLLKVVRFVELIWDRTHQAPSSKGRIVRWPHGPNDHGQNIGRGWIKIAPKAKKGFDNKTLIFLTYTIQYWITHFACTRIYVKYRTVYQLLFLSSCTKRVIL